MQKTPDDDWVSLAVVSDGSYGVAKGIVSSFPCRVPDRGAGGAFEIVQGVTLNDYAQAKIATTIAELEREREIVKDLLAS